MMQNDVIEWEDTMFPSIGRTVLDEATFWFWLLKWIRKLTLKFVEMNSMVGN